MTLHTTDCCVIITGGKMWDWKIFTKSRDDEGYDRFLVGGIHKVKRYVSMILVVSQECKPN